MKPFHVHICFLGLLAFLPFLSQAQTNLDSGLVAIYSFTGNADDESGNGNNGAVFSASLTTDRFGQDSSAYEFDGIDDYINFGDTPEFRFTTDFSFSLWIYHPGFDQKGAILQKREIVYPFTLWGLNAGESPQNYVESKYVLFSHREDGLDPTLGTRKYVAKPSGVLEQGWHHLVVLNDISARAYLYVDNVLIDSSEAIAGTGEVAGYPLMAGASNDPNDGIFNFFNGKIDDIRLYNRLLSVPEIDSLFHEMPMTTSIGPSFLDNHIRMFPNPSSGKLHIVSPALAITSVHLYDLTGRELPIRAEVSRHEAVLSSASDFRGLGMVEIRTARGVVMKKVVFE